MSGNIVSVYLLVAQPSQFLPSLPLHPFCCLQSVRGKQILRFNKLSIISTFEQANITRTMGLSKQTANLTVKNEDGVKKHDSGRGETERF